MTVRSVISVRGVSHVIVLMLVGVLLLIASVWVRSYFVQDEMVIMRGWRILACHGWLYVDNEFEVCEARDEWKVYDAKLKISLREIDSWMHELKRRNEDV